MTKPIAVRFAPSPTGPLHIGGVRTALYNYLFARQHGGRLLLRIEDTDQGRLVEGAENYIQQSLAWLGIRFDEGVAEGGPHGPYRQSERAALGMYQQYADQLLASGWAYYAFDSGDELEAMRDRLQKEEASIQGYNAHTRGSMLNSFTLSPEEVQERVARGDSYVIRFNMPADLDIEFQDIVRGTVSFHSSQLDDKVLLKAGGMPTYHLANVVDDHLMEISHVIRGEEWLSSTPLHVMLYRALGWEDTMPAFVHLPLILNPNGQGKMSKRTGDKLGFSVFPCTWQDPESGNVSVGYREQGYFPEAMINFLALLGWNPGDEEEIMDRDRLIERFRLERINQSPTNFNLDKLKWFNEQYLRTQTEEAELVRQLAAAAKAEGFDNLGESQLQGVVRLMRERVSFVHEMISQGRFLLEAPESYDEAMKAKQWKEQTGEWMLALANAWEEVATWELMALEAATEAWAAGAGIGKGKIMAPLRLALTGVSGGPGVMDIAAFLGKPETLARLRKAAHSLG